MWKNSSKVVYACILRIDGSILDGSAPLTGSNVAKLQ